METWKPIAEDPRYAVSDLGRVRGQSDILKPRNAGAGYQCVHIQRKNRYIHRLVAEAFIGPCPPGHEVLHRDHDKKNCRLDNLRYGTHAENMAENNMPKGASHWNYKHGGYVGL